MATTALEGTPVHTVGDLPAIGDQAPAYTLVGNDLGEVNSSEFADSRVVLNIFPSVDTGVCAASVRRFNELASGLENTTVVCVSNDLPSRRPASAVPRASRTSSPPPASAAPSARNTE